MKQPNDTENLVVSLTEFEEDFTMLGGKFSISYKTNELFQKCIELQEEGSYFRARSLFYNNLGWYEPIMDEFFIINCQDIIAKYNQIEYTSKYNYDQIEQIKYIRILLEFSKLITRVSTEKYDDLYRQPDKLIELVPRGFGIIFKYESMAVEIFNALARIERHGTYLDIIQFFNHTSPWFGGLMDLDFMLKGYQIVNSEKDDQTKYRRLVGIFAKLLSRHTVTATPFATLVYKPQWEASQVPHCIEDIIKQFDNVQGEELNAPLS